MLPSDTSLHPVVGIQAHEYFMQEIYGESDLVGMAEMMFSELLKDITDKEYIAGINRIKSKYKAVYNRYRPQWEKLLKEKAD